MKTAEEKALEWLEENRDAIRGIDLSFYGSALIPEIVTLLKRQDRDTRHACAEACMGATTNSNLEIVSQAYHDICINVKAV